MKEATKQRIVGTVVLLALGLIFLPIIFDGEGSYQVPVSSRIPDPPAVPILPEPGINRPQILAERELTQDTTATVSPDTSDADMPAEQEPPAEPVAGAEEVVQVVESEPVFERGSPQFDADGLPQGWVVRLGTFANGSNASNLVSRLQDSGYKAYSRNIESDQGMMTAVFVGPWLQREQVEEYQRQLQEQFQLSGMIVRYEIEPL